VQARYQYDAWGNKRNETGTSRNRFGFTGHEEDKETGLIYAKARFYDPDTARFLSQDAWEGDNSLAPSLHKYLYAYQNPTVYVDPDGNSAVPAPQATPVIQSAAAGAEHTFVNSAVAANSTRFVAQRYILGALGPVGWGAAGYFEARRHEQIQEDLLIATQQAAAAVAVERYNRLEVARTESRACNCTTPELVIAQSEVEELESVRPQISPAIDPNTRIGRQGLAENPGTDAVAGLAPPVQKNDKPVLISESLDKPSTERSKSGFYVDDEVQSYERPPGSVRKQDYPTRERKTTRKRLEGAATGPDGVIRCQNVDCRVEGGRVLQQGEGAIEHNPPLVQTHNEQGYNTNQETRNDLYNETATEIHCIDCQRRQGGQTQDRYRRDVGSNYESRQSRRKKDDS